MPNERNKNVPTHIIGIMGASNSVSIKIERRTYRALVDMGAEVSVIRSRVFKKLRLELELQKKDIKLRTANGSPITC